jgi:NAD(P)-dependent dehydrogenase (short-subunit alcohol dehydrogenase family)
MGAYAATKSAVDAIARTAATELADRKIRVMCCSRIDRYTYESANTCRYKKCHSSSSSIETNRTAEEIANAIVFLSSNEASYISGSYLAVDGGVTIRR